MYVSHNCENCIYDLFNRCAKKFLIKWYIDLFPPRDYKYLPELEKVWVAYFYLSSFNVMNQVSDNAQQSGRYDLDAVTLKRLQFFLRIWDRRYTLAELRKFTQMLLDRGMVKDHLANPQTEMHINLQYFPTIKTLKILERLSLD